MTTAYGTSARSAQRLLEAVGYLELGMFAQARASLSGVEACGELRTAVEAIRDEADRREGRLGDDAVPLELLCPMAPEPAGEELLLMLAHCFWEAGDRQRAMEAFSYTQPPPGRRLLCKGKPGSKHGSTP